MFRGLGVPKSTMARYTRNSYLLKHKKHIYLNGVCDPTGHLPEGSIFITGYCKNERGNRKHFSQVHEKMLVTRSPCLEPTDAKLLPVVGNKPIHMPQDEWNWLLDLPFGVIIFARARPENRENCAPTPMMVADGDLDGDLYMILFDEELRKSLDQAFEDPRMIAAIQRQEDDVRNQRINCKEGPPVGENGPADWFHQAQLEMVKFDRKAIIGKATGTLYKASHRIANDSKDGIWHPDAIACARGFKQALDAPKHGNLIELPSRLKTSTSNATKSIKSIHECISWT